MHSYSIYLLEELFIQNENIVAYNHIININVASIITQHLHTNSSLIMLQSLMKILHLNLQDNKTLDKESSVYCVRTE